MTKFIAFAFLIISCSSYKKPLQEPRLFRPNYNLKVDDLLKNGYVFEEAEDDFLAVKQVNDTTNVKIQVDEKLGILLKEIWQVKFKKTDIEELNYFLLNHSSIIVTEMCDSDSDVIRDGEQTTEKSTMNFNFFVQNTSSGRFFQCNFGDEEDGSGLLQIVHDYPFIYKDENNPKFRKVFKDWKEILEVQEENEKFSNNKSKHWRP